MKLLLIHPEDRLQNGPWAGLRWDRIVDLGRSGRASYCAAVAHYGCDVSPVDSLREGFAEIHAVRELLAHGLGHVADRFGIDWWELTAILAHSQIESLTLLKKLAATIEPGAEVHITRPGFSASALELLLGSQVQVISRANDSRKRGLGHYVRVARKFPLRQLTQIFWDKTDAGYQWRGRVSTRAKPHKKPVVLLPTAYVNVSRTGIGYAKAIPELDFLLVATRPSGWLSDVPSNVGRAWLRSYASFDVRGRRDEFQHLMECWKGLRAKLEAEVIFKTFADLGGFDDFPAKVAQGLEIRDAWRNVFDREPVQAVLCADDSNPYTHLPLLLAEKRSLQTVACHHGALDGRYMLKQTHADALLAKGAMEEDYLVRVCGVPREKVEVGAPPGGERVKANRAMNSNSPIVFFSEVYEVSGNGRTVEFYRDVLPSLADLAIQHGRELIVKLHPAESLVERTKFALEVLSENQRKVTRVVAGRLDPTFLSSIWFGVTVLSSVAVECVVLNIPCFLCRWLEFWPYGYIDQFLRFGVGIGLDRPEDMARIPELLAAYRPSAALAETCSKPIVRQRLQELLASSERAAPVAVTEGRT